jgi:D-alanine--D-alanine ligase
MGASAKEIVIGVFRGGISPEKNVSLESGKSVFDALKSRGYRVVDCVVENDRVEHIEALVRDNGVELAFIVMHGEFGEDGRIQAMFEDMGIPYTGSGPEASWIAMDKVETHRCLEEAKIPMAQWCSFKDGDAVDAAALVARFGLPLVIKPSTAGSSVGVTVARDAGDIVGGVRTALSHSPDAVVEHFIDGREFTVGVVGETVLPVVEIRANAKFFDFHSKYVDDKTETICPAEISDALRETMQQRALEVFRAMQCRTLGRVDFRVDAEGNAFVLEMNSIPGFMSHSLLPLAASRIGLSFADLCEKIVSLSVE